MIYSFESALHTSVDVLAKRPYHETLAVFDKYKDQLKAEAEEKAKQEKAMKAQSHYKVRKPK